VLKRILGIFDTVYWSWEKFLNRNNMFLQCLEIGTESSDWPEHIHRLFEHQIQHWPLLRQNAERLGATRVRSIPVGNVEILAQYNPERRSSTTAKVDPASVSERPCKLCPDNLFPEQRGLAYGENLIVLCNPFPILRSHLSIVHRAHLPQALHNHVPLLLNLARDLGKTFFLFYNGPQCGASAPDHFHVQACGRDNLPLFHHLNPIETALARRIIQREPGIELSTLNPYHVCVLVYRGTEPGMLAKWIERTIEALAELTNALAEPLLNLLAWYDEEQWTVCLFPRATHRPACYYDGTLVVSPASLDMAGLLVFPFQEHFEVLTPEDVAQIYAEVSLSPQLFLRLLERLTDSKMASA
jgi:hypothetical protein